MQNFDSSKLLPRKTLQEGERGDDVIALTTYLQKFGYLSKTQTNDRSLYDENVAEAVRRFQKFYSLTEDGTVNEETLNLLSTPRCSYPDIVSNEVQDKYYIICKWRKTNLRYHVVDYLPNLNQEAQRNAFINALSQWASQSGLTISEGPVGSEIQMLVYGGDGIQGGDTLAEGFPPCLPYPPIKHGNVYFDINENWSMSIPATGNQDFYTIALHEIGHALGLGHVGNTRCVMYGQFERGEIRRTLCQDDIDGIRAMYPRL